MKKKFICTIFLCSVLSMGTALAQNDSVVFPTNTPSGQATGGYFSKYFENIMQRHTTDDGATIQNGPCPADHIIVWFVAPTGNTYEEKVRKGGIPKCKHKDTFNLEASFFKKWSGLQWENRWLPMWAGWAGKEGTLLEKSILFQQKAPNLTLWEDTIEANGGLSVGKMWESTATRAQGPEYGSRLFFEGKDTKYNSDIVAMYRYNRGDDQTDLRMVVGDNEDNEWWAMVKTDRFQIGVAKDPVTWAMNARRDNDFFMPKFTFTSDGKFGILTENPEYNLHVNGTTKLDGETIVKGPLTVNNGPVTIEKWDLVVKGGELKLPASTYKDGWILVSRGDKVSSETMTELATNSKDDFIAAIKKLFPDLCVPRGESWYGNVCYGERALKKNTTGMTNVAIGRSALEENVTWIGNTAIGTNALGHNLSWWWNEAIGKEALWLFTKGDKNSAIWTFALRHMEQGNNNVAIGALAGYFMEKGDNNIFIGSNTTWSRVSQKFQVDNFLNIGDWIRWHNGDIKIGGDSTILENVDLEVTSDDNSELMISTPNDSWYATLWLYRKTVNNHNGWAIANNPGNNGLEFNYDFERGKIGKHVLFLWKDGNVGVGTMTPSAKLHVADGSAIVENKGGWTALRLASPLSERSIVHFYHNNPENQNRGWSLGRFGVENKFLLNYDNESWKSQMRALTVLPTGEVGIGTDTPASKLHVDGEIYAKNEYKDLIRIGGDAAGNDIEFSLLEGNRNMVTFYNYVTRRQLDINAWGGFFQWNVEALAYFYKSDERLKDNISTIEDPKKILLGLRGVRFDWKETGRHTLGLIAQEVEKVLPELVHTDEKWYKSVEYANIVAVLIEGFKSQQSEIESLKQQIESQKSDIEFLKQEIEKLKNSQK